MTDESIKEAVELLKKDGYWGENKNVKAFDVLLDLAEQYLKIAGKMPKEKETDVASVRLLDQRSQGYIVGANEMRQSCILAFMVLLPEKRHCCNNCYLTDVEEAEIKGFNRAIDTIHQRLETGR